MGPPAPPPDPQFAYQPPDPNRPPAMRHRHRTAYRVAGPTAPMDRERSALRSGAGFAPTFPTRPLGGVSLQQAARPRENADDINLGRPVRWLSCSKPAKEAARRPPV